MRKLLAAVLALAPVAAANTVGLLFETTNDPRVVLFMLSTLLIIGFVGYRTIKHKEFRFKAKRKHV